MRIAVGIAVLAIAAHAANAGGGFESVRAKGTVKASATGTLLGETVAIPASTSRAATSEEIEERALTGSAKLAPDLGLVEGEATGAFSAVLDGHVLSASLSGGAKAKAAEDEDHDNALLMAAASSVTLTFSLANTVAADLAIALDRDDGYTSVTTTLSGPAMAPQIIVDTPGRVARALILPPGDYSLTFSHVAAAGVESDADAEERESGSRGSARVSLTIDPCGADCNGDNKLDVLDFICFQQGMEDQLELVDLNKDGNIDVLDMFVFNELFAGGCG